MSNLVEILFSYLDLIWQLLAYAITWISLVVSIILNPYLLLMCVLTLSNVYVILKSKTRKELVLNYGSFFSMCSKAAYGIVIAIIPVMMGVISYVVNLVSGVMSSPSVVIFGTGVSPGTVFAVAIAILLLLYSVL